MHVLIAGGGIGGLTAAIAFAKFGHQVTVAEQANRIEEVGAGLQLSPNGMRVFDMLGVSARIEANAFRPRAQEIRMGKGGLRILSIPLREASRARWGGEYLHVHRADLIDSLKVVLDERQPDALRLGARVTGYTNKDHSIVAHLEDGGTIEADLLIGADGIHSVVREQMIGPDKPRYTGNVAWRAVAPVMELGEHAPPETACVWVGSRSGTL